MRSRATAHARSSFEGELTSVVSSTGRAALLAHGGVGADGDGGGGVLFCCGGGGIVGCAPRRGAVIGMGDEEEAADED